MRRLSPLWWLRLWRRQIVYAWGCDPQTSSDRITSRQGWPTTGDKEQQ